MLIFIRDMNAISIFSYKSNYAINITEHEGIQFFIHLNIQTKSRRRFIMLISHYASKYFRSW